MIQYGWRQQGAQLALVSDIPSFLPVFKSLDYRWYHQIPNVNFDLRGNKMKLSEVNLTHKPPFLMSLMSSCLLVQCKKVISGDHNGSNMSPHN